MKRKLVNQIQFLITEGKKFTFQNFCYPHEQYGKYGGEDTPKWLTWKTRSFNLVNRLASSNSPAATLAKKAIGIRTEGYYPKNFEQLKQTMFSALELSAESVKNDPFEELGFWQRQYREILGI